jgi:hypothetical protein
MHVGEAPLPQPWRIAYGGIGPLRYLSVRASSPKVFRVKLASFTYRMGHTKFVVIMDRAGMARANQVLMFMTHFVQIVENNYPERLA